MRILLQGIAILAHPIFLPIYSLFIYSPFVAGLDISRSIVGAIWILFVYLILPLVYFKVVRKINLPDPSLTERRSIYRTYSIINIGFAVVNVFLIHEYISFFLAAGFMHLLLWFLVYLELKASWHSAIWTFLLGVGLMMMYRFNFVGMPMLLISFLAITSIVIATRYFQKAHTMFELGMGAAVGALCSAFVLFF